jgi:chromosome partitioning protein
MKAVSFYNLKGGVGKTTAAVNVAYLAAACGQRVLLWDLDPQGAASFILRIRAHVADFGRKTLQSGTALSAAIKETDYRNLDLLPADFSYRKFDRVLDHLGKPARVLKDVLHTIGGDYDVVFLDCPAGFSLLTEAVLEISDETCVPTIPTPLSVRTLARILKWADRSGLPLHVRPFLSMVDRRKMLHRRTCEWSAMHSGAFLNAQIPYASVVEQITVRRMPLAEFAARDAAAEGFAELWADLRARLRRHSDRAEPRVASCPSLVLIESLAAELEYVQEREAVADVVATTAASAEADLTGEAVVHSFDTEDQNLSRTGHLLELREYATSFVVAAGRTSDASDDIRRAHVQIDGSWAMQILSGEMSPLVVLDRRLTHPRPSFVEDIRAIVGRRKLCRVDSRMANPATSEGLSAAASCA